MSYVSCPVNSKRLAQNQWSKHSNGNASSASPPTTTVTVIVFIATTTDVSSTLAMHTYTI